MTSLADVYEGGNRVASRRRLYLATLVFLTGAAFVLAGIAFATSTGVARAFGLRWYEARELAGLLAGLGVPAVLVSVFSVLPAGRRVRAAAAIGASVSVFGVALFLRVYPDHWVGDPADYTLLVAAIYFLGTIIAIWCLFVGIANFKSRNDPGGTVKLEITRGGETRVVEVEGGNLRRRLGSVGVLGELPDEEAETQTNRERASPSSSAASGGGFRSGSRSRSRSSTATTGPASGVASPVSDGGAAAGPQISSVGGDDGGGPPVTDDAEVLESGTRDLTDTYCGNCAHFRYVRTSNGMQPYCEAHDTFMDDMDPCEQWAPNR